MLLAVRTRRQRRLRPEVGAPYRLRPRITRQPAAVDEAETKSIRQLEAELPILPANGGGETLLLRAAAGAPPAAAAAQDENRTVVAAGVTFRTAAQTTEEERTLQVRALPRPTDQIVSL